ncbi:hypothetical protein CTH30272_00010 [Allocatenococcus thiocycli]|nr:hypothetical protein CTH30272_00010 [Catenococcus thiocycli]
MCQLFAIPYQLMVHITDIIFFITHQTINSTLYVLTMSITFQFLGFSIPALSRNEYANSRLLLPLYRLHSATTQNQF